MRDLLQETTVSVNDLIYPIFVEEELDDFAPVDSMPGVFRIPERKLDTAIKEIAAAGIKAVMTFGVSHRKDDTGSDAWNCDGLLARMIKRAKDAAPGAGGDLRHLLLRIHLARPLRRDPRRRRPQRPDDREAGQAGGDCREAGADMIAPSSMMDGQVTAIRAALDGAAHKHADHGVFVEVRLGVLRTVPRGGRMRSGGRPQGLSDEPDERAGGAAESDVDEAEGADILMVKPAMPYLDVLAKIRQRSLLPLAAYRSAANTR